MVGIKDWNSYIYDLGKEHVRRFLVANALYWFEQFHIDGIRVDAVASMLYLDYSRSHDQWIPNADGGNENFDAIATLKWMNEEVYKHFPNAMTIAEESTAFPGVPAPTFMGGLGFGFKWNMGWMHDSLSYIQRRLINHVLNIITIRLPSHWFMHTVKNYMLAFSCLTMRWFYGKRFYPWQDAWWWVATNSLNLRAYMGYMLNTFLE